jgi:hypothetical protein
MMAHNDRSLHRNISLHVTKPFMRFNLSWLAYLIYAVVWVAVIAPIFD